MAGLLIPLIATPVVLALIVVVEMGLFLWHIRDHCGRQDHGPARGEGAGRA